MTAEERSLLEALDTIVGSEEIRAQIYSIVERVRTELARNKKAEMTWEPIPLTIYGGALPSGIRSSWVFVLRAGATTGAERHPNSHQRMMSFEATGDLQSEPDWRTAASASGDPMFWCVSRARHLNGDGFRFLETSGTKLWCRRVLIGWLFLFTPFRQR